MITSIATFHHLRVLRLAVGAVAIAAGAVWITASAAGINVGFRPAASTSAPSPGAPTASGGQQSGKASAVCNSFVSHFASDLGTTQSKVDAAFQKAVGQTLDDEVKNGAMTQAQADAIKQKIGGQAPCALMPSAPKTPSGGFGGYKQALLSAAASALGITDQQLAADLAQGMTLSQIAAAQNPPVSEAQFRDRLITKLTPLLDAAVTKKQLTTAQEQAIIQQLKTAPIPYWNRPMPAPKKPATASPAAT